MPPPERLKFNYSVYVASQECGWAENILSIDECVRGEGAGYLFRWFCMSMHIERSGGVPG